MKLFNRIIELMSKEEVRAFKLFTLRTGQKEGRKDMELLDYTRKAGSAYSETLIFRKIYPDEPINTFHRLKSRLLNEINKSQILLHIDTNDLIRLFHFLTLVEFYQVKENFDLAFHYLRKAERKAVLLEKYDVLDMVYNESIRLSQHVIFINPEEYIEKRRKNSKVLSQLRELDDILATVNYRVRITQNYGQADNSVVEILEKTIREYGETDIARTNPAIRFRIYEAASKILLEKRDFEALEEYLIQSYFDFHKDKLFTRSTHESKLQMLAYLVNTLFKNEKIEESLRFANELGVAMKEFNSLHYAKYEFFYYNALVINYFRTDIPEAIRILEEMKKKKSIRNIPFYLLFVEMNLAISWYMLRNLKKAIRYLAGTYILEGYRKAAPGLKLKIGVAELMIRFDLQDYEVIINRGRQLQNDFKELLYDSGFERERLAIDLIIKMNETTGIQKDSNLIKEVKKFLKLPPPEDSQEEIINYEEFFREKFNL